MDSTTSSLWNKMLKWRMLSKNAFANIRKRNSSKSFDAIGRNFARSGKLKFSEETLVVAFIDPTGISQVPMNAMLQLTKNKRIDLLVTIQHSLGITRNLSQYLKSEAGQTAMDRFLASEEWRKWKWKDPSELARLAIDAFGKRINLEGFIGTRHISIPEHHPLYRFTLFSRHERAENFWNKILKIDESGQRELL